MNNEHVHTVTTSTSTVQDMTGDPITVVFDQDRFEGVGIEAAAPEFDLDPSVARALATALNFYANMVDTAGEL